MTRTLTRCPACKSDLDDEFDYCSTCRNRTIVERLDAIHLKPSTCDYRCRSFGIEQIRYWSHAIGVCPCVSEARR